MFPYTNSTLEGPYFSPLFHSPPFFDDGFLGSHHNWGMNNPPSDEKKKDRHSKICTAQGLRERRMRLSVKVARKFFDLQDMLDFDKASKTIEWLLVNSEAAIQELVRTSNCNGKCMSMSMSMSMSSETRNKEIKTGEEDQSLGREARKKRRTSTCIARESRDKARERARERTRLKMKLKTSKQAPKDSANEFPANNETIIRTVEGAAMTSKKASSQGNGQNMFPKAISQEHSSILMTISNGEQWNPSSAFGITPNAQDQHNPNSIFINTNALDLGIPSPIFTANIGFHSHFQGTHFL